MENLKYSSPIILASGSPRRKEFLEYLGYPFEVKVSDVEEISSKTSPSDVALDIAKLKASHVYDQLDAEEKKQKNIIVIGADTIVTLDGKILGKPKDHQDALKMLSFLSGREHEVITGVSICYHYSQHHQNQPYQKKCFKDFYVSSFVEFAPLEENLDLYQNYAATSDPIDKAGAYGIQGAALTFIKSMRGSYSNVVGLPLFEVGQALKEILTEMKQQTVVGQ